MTKEKKLGVGLDMWTVVDKTGRPLLVLKTHNGAYHVFTEIETKEALARCGANTNIGNTRSIAKRLFKR